MRNDGYSENTIAPIGTRLRNLTKRVDLDEPEEVKRFLAGTEWSNGYKENMVNAYNHYAVVHGLSWKRPRYQRAYSIKRLPLEADIDLIIRYTKIKNRVAFRLIKECGLRPIEVSELTPAHIDLDRGTVHPETAKGGGARVLKLKKDTLAMLVRLLVDKSLHENIFSKSKSLQKNWCRLRNILAERYGKTELKQIRLYDLRHFYGTMLYHETKDLVHVQRKMGHRNIKSTLTYIDLADFRKEEEEYISKVVCTPEQIQQLIESGFEYVCQRHDLVFFRKRK